MHANAFVRLTQHLAGVSQVVEIGPVGRLDPQRTELFVHRQLGPGFGDALPIVQALQFTSTAQASQQPCSQTAMAYDEGARQQMQWLALALELRLCSCHFAILWQFS